MWKQTAKRIAVGAAALVAIAATAVWYSPSLQDRLLRRVAERQLGSALPALPASTALRLVFCGTGSPLPDARVAKSCLAVIAGDRWFVVDSGPESTEKLLAWRLPLGQLNGVLLTHFHSDHIGELGELNLQSWLQGRQSPLPVYGPPGVENVVAGFNLAYEQDQAVRHAHHARDRGLLPLAAAKLTAHGVLVTPSSALAGTDSSVVYDHDGLRIVAFNVDHGVVRPAYGYRFDYRGRSVVVSGDTRDTPAVAIAAKGADVLVHEAQSKALVAVLAAAAAHTGNRQVSLLLGDTNDYHSSPAEAAALANAAGVRELVFTHFTPPISNPLVKRAFLRDMAGTRRDHWRTAEDGLWIDIPADGGPLQSGMLRR
jgi:ribonuclease Z